MSPLAQTRVYPNKMTQRETWSLERRAMWLEGWGFETV